MTNQRSLFTAGHKAATDFYEPPVDRRALFEKCLAGLNPEPSSTVRDLAFSTIRRRKTVSSVTGALQELRFFLRWCASEGIDPLCVTSEVAHSYAVSLRTYVSGTQHQKLLIAHGFFERAVRLDLLEVNPFAECILPSRVPETPTPTLTKEEAEHLVRSIHACFDETSEGLRAKRDYTLITMTMRMCLLLREITSLRWGEFEETESGARLSMRGSSRLSRHLVVPADMWATVLKWRRAFEKHAGVELGPEDAVFPAIPHSEPDDPRFHTVPGPVSPLSRMGVYRLVTDRLAAIEIRRDGVGPHALRLTGAVLAYQAGATLPQLQALLRQGSVSVTATFLSIMGIAATETVSDAPFDEPAWVDLGGAPTSMGEQGRRDVGVEEG